MKAYKLKQIETPRLIIRPVQLGDEFELNQAVNRSLASLLPWMPWANDPSLEATRNFVQKGVFARNSRSIVNFPMVIIHKKDQKMISASGYNEQSDPENGLYEIGYWCDIDYQGQGYVTEFANALTQYALEELKAKTVVIRMEVDNKKSEAVAKRLNFVNQGTRPSTIKDNATDHYYTCKNPDSLPELKISWNYNANQSNDTKVIAWAKAHLNISDEKAFAESKMIVKTPWSSVIAINTGADIVYLKHMPQKIALEAEIINELKNQFNAPVPEVIAINNAESCFLMKNAGVTLRTLLKQKFDANLLCRAIEQFTNLQITIGSHVKALLKLGVPDWKTDKLTALFAEFLEQQDLLLSEGLSEDEISQLKALLPKIGSLCEKLSCFAVDDTLVQCDFHDNNILYDAATDRLTHIDLGEIVISHPFFSLVTCLQKIQTYYALTEQDLNFQKIQTACLKNFITIDTEENLRSAFIISKTLWYVYEAIAQYRLIQACDREEIMSFQRGKLGKTLKILLLRTKKSK